MKKFLIFAIFAAFLLLPKNAAAVSLIRDAEIEELMREYSSPIFKVAGIPPSSVRLFLVNDDSLNAYVAGGMNMFIHTGLLTRAKTPEMVIGVLAHETGHIDGSHLIKRLQEYEDLSLQTVLTSVLGAAVTVAGLPDAGAAILVGGQHISGRQLASYSREQEVAADQAALRYLGETSQSARGLLDVMQILRRDSVLNFDALDQYALSHPLTSQRISQLRSHLEDKPPLEESKFTQRHLRMVAKLEGFLEKPEFVLEKYDDDSIASRYARSVANYRDGKIDESFADLDLMLQAEPKNPFFNELKGQILAENERIVEAEKYYALADEYYPDSALLLNELGKLQIANGKAKDGIATIEKAVRIEPRNSTAWHLLAKAYGKMGDEAHLKFAQANEAAVQGKTDLAHKYASKAKELFEEDSAEWLAMNDLLNEIKLKKDRK